MQGSKNSIGSWRTYKLSSALQWEQSVKKGLLVAAHLYSLRVIKYFQTQRYFQLQRYFQIWQITRKSKHERWRICSTQSVLQAARINILFCWTLNPSKPIDTIRALVFHSTTSKYYRRADNARLTFLVLKSDFNARKIQLYIKILYITSV